MKTADLIGIGVLVAGAGGGGYFLWRSRQGAAAAAPVAASPPEAPPPTPKQRNVLDDLSGFAKGTTSLFNVGKDLWGSASSLFR